MRYSIIHHDIREQFELTISQYLVADSIHQLSRKGVCTMGDQKLADFLGLSREHVSRSRSSLLEKGLVEKVEGGHMSSQKWHEAVTFKSVTKNHKEAGSEQNVTESGEIVTSLLIDKEIIKPVAKATLSPFQIVSDSPVSRSPKKDNGVLSLRQRLYVLFKKEYGVEPTPNMGDYKRVEAALKRLTEKQVIDLVEDALDGSRAPRTVREALTDRAIDTYLQNA